MYTKRDLIQNLRGLGVRPGDTLLVHSSMRAVGEVEGGADTVLDAFRNIWRTACWFFHPHLVPHQRFPPLYDPETEPACVGLLPNLFRQRPGVIRSLHPTHSLAALGRDAAAFTEGGGATGNGLSPKRLLRTPVRPGGKNSFPGLPADLQHVPAWGGGVVRRAQRITDTYEQLYIRLPWGVTMERPMRRHYHPGEWTSPANTARWARLPGQGPGAQRDGGRRGQHLMCDARGWRTSPPRIWNGTPICSPRKPPLPEEWYR